MRIAAVLLVVTAILMVLPRPHTSAVAQDYAVSVSSVTDTRDATKSTNTQRPRTTRHDLPSARRGIAVESLGMSNRLAPLNLANHRKSKPNEIGVVRRVDLSSAASTSRQILNADGSRIRLLTIESPGAVEMRVHLSDFDLPQGDEVYIYGLAENSRVFGPYHQRGLTRTEKPGRGSSSGFWSNTVIGDTIVIEHLIRGEERPFSVSEVLHNYEPFLTADQAPNLLNCHVDAKCVAEPLNNAAARISFVEDTGSFFCSATMMNNQMSDFAPYVLTAGHCVSDQLVAASVEALWFYTSTFCNSNIAAEGVLSPVGATVLNSGINSDQTLLRILSGVPFGLTFAGWTSQSLDNGAGVFGLHFPAASFLRRSTGAITETSIDCQAAGLVGGYRVGWSSGATEPGSSGSGLFNDDLNPGNQVLVGVASCGFNSNGQPFCGSDEVYGKFSSFFPDIQDFLVFGDRGKSPVATTIGTSHNGTLTTTSSLNRVDGASFYWKGYYFTGQAGQRIQINSTSSAFDTYLYVLDPLHRFIAADDDSGGGPNSSLTLTLLVSGEYVIGVSSFFGGDTGAFQLNTQLVSRFDDVPPSNTFYRYANLLAEYGITVGCNPPQNNLYCPANGVTRDQMAAFIMRALGEFDPPFPVSQRFVDVPPSNIFYRFINRLAARGITVGCNPPFNDQYCPSGTVTREQMSAFLIRALGEFNPPNPPFQRFADVPPTNIFYRFIERLAARGITVGCNPVGPLYCPDQVASREQMAAFLVRAFGLE